MRTTLIFSILLVSSTFWAQENIKTEIKAQNVFDISIINLYPENYPNVSVVFQAKNKEGKPLWLLRKDEINITENGDYCKVLKLINITKDKPLNISLVFDHSGSMIDNPEQLPKGVDSYQLQYLNGGSLPPGYIMPIEYAKKGVNSFLKMKTSPNDSILFVGFSSQVDKISALTNKPNLIKYYLNSVEPSGSTAFYDALYKSINRLKNRSSQPIIVAITDGQDNSSINTYQKVIEYAQIHKIPIYIIGLGDVDEYTLNEITSATSGFYYHTNRPEQLETIYKNIKEQLKSIYQLDYVSGSDDYYNNERELKFSFVNDTLTFSNPSSKFLVPESALEYLNNKEKERLDLIERKKQEAQIMNLTNGGIGLGILLLGIGGFVLIRKRKTYIQITEIFPNPFEDNITVKYLVDDTIGDAELKIFNIRGNQISSHPIISTLSEISIETTTYERGVYVFKIIGSGKSSTGYKLVKKYIFDFSVELHTVPKPNFELKFNFANNPQFATLKAAAKLNP